ncbi:hypothetical protein V6N13_047433 [Hibiscus sabdariffa]
MLIRLRIFEFMVLGRVIRFERINPSSPIRPPSPSPIDNCLARITKLP